VEALKKFNYTAAVYRTTKEIKRRNTGKKEKRGGYVEFSFLFDDYPEKR
jgi:hypothetical protein